MGKKKRRFNMTTTIKKSPNTKEQHAWLKKKQEEHRAKGMTRAECWMYKKLVTRTGWNWTFQAIWGWRLFDFWCRDIGVAVEVDGPEHDTEWDSVRDRSNFKKSAIIVLRVPNFDEAAAERSHVVDKENGGLSA